MHAFKTTCDEGGSSGQLLMGIRAMGHGKLVTLFTPDQLVTMLGTLAVVSKV